MSLRFVNDIIKPWDELNEILVQRYVFQPELSDVTRLASSIAIPIKHYSEHASIARKIVNSESVDNKLMSDVADAAKHGKLKNSYRNNKLYVAALFECNNYNQFRFIRNAIYIDHASAGGLDFMVVSLKAISYWIYRKGITINWQGVVKEAPEEFHPTAFLYYNPKYCIKMSEARLIFFKRKENDTLQPYDPPEVRFEIY
jgi:hypothetical protein